MPEDTKIEIADEVIEVLDYLGEKFGIAYDWGTENVMLKVTELCDKYITWQTYTSIVWIVAAVLVIIAALIFAVRFTKEHNDNFGWVCFVAITVVASIIIFCQIFDIVEALTFPEKSIYDYIQWSKMWGGN